METKAFPSKITMLQYLEKRVEGLDLNTSAFAPKFSFATLKGDYFNCPNAMTFVNDFNKVFGDTLDINGCRTVGGGRGKCILTFLEKEDLDKETLPVVEDTPTTTEEEVSTEDIEVLVVENIVEEVTTEDIVEEVTATPEVTEDTTQSITENSSEEDTEAKFNLEYATSLQEDKSKKEAKAALEAYGRTLKIELNRQKTFSNMLIDLQEAL